MSKPSNMSNEEKGEKITDHEFINPCHCGCDGREMKCNHYDVDGNECLKDRENHTPPPRENIREEFRKWEAKFDEDGPTIGDLFDFFLSRCIPRDELKEEIRKIKHEIDLKEGKDLDNWSDIGKVAYYYLNRLESKLLALISNK